MMETVDCVSIVSGGLDSTVMMYKNHNAGMKQLCLSFDYGQKHKRELDFALHNCRRLGISWAKIDLTSLTTLLHSALTTHGEHVPEGHYAAENMKSTVVPNRNAIMLAIAYGVAASHDAHWVATAVHAGDHPIYPDCRPEFVNAFRDMEILALKDVSINTVLPLTPFIDLTKAQIVSIGAGQGVPFKDTWSCYNGRTVHCGVCGTCVERYEAFVKAGIADPTVYEQDPRVHLQEA